MKGPRFTFVEGTKKKPMPRKTVSVKELKKIRFGILDSSLDKQFGTKTKRVGWTSLVPNYWR